MNIQSALNSVLADASNVAFRSGLLEHMKKTEQWFGDKPSKDKPTKEDKQQNKIQKQYEKSGQAQADQEAMAAYEEYTGMGLGEAKAVQRVVEQTQTYQNQKENLAKRKEYLKKPRMLNRHGVLYQEVMKDGK